MEQMALLNEKLELLRRGIQEFSILQSRVTELDSLTRTMSAYNQHMVSQLTDAQALIEQWRNFFALSLDMLCIADTEGYFLDVNPAFIRTLGYQREELLCQPFIDFVHPEDRDATMAEVIKLATGIDTISFENRYRCKDGRWLWLNWTTPAPTPGSKLLYAIARDVTERKRTEAEVLYLAQHDSLTHLYNRAALLHEIGVACKRFQRDPRYHVALLFIDLDGFKPINDQHGHQVGDQLLAEVGRRLRSSARSTDVIARIGGDEFVVLVQGYDNLDADSLAPRFQNSFSKPFPLASQMLALSASMGYALLDDEAVSAEQLLALADQKMYEHKRRLVRTA